MKAIKNSSLTCLTVLIVCMKSFATFTYPAEPVRIGGVREVPVKPSLSSTGNNPAASFYSHATSISFLNFHQTGFSSKVKHVKNPLAIEAGYVDSYHSTFAYPYSKGVSARICVKYSALLSIGCVWNIAWGTKQIGEAGHSTIHPTKSCQMNITVIMSNPVKIGKTESALMHKLNTNLTLETLSIVEVVVNFARF